MLRKILNRLMRPYIVTSPPHVERQLGSLNEQERFAHTYHTVYWKSTGKGPRSGEGSSMLAADAIRTSLPAMPKARGICSMLDLPCGDWQWMSTFDLGDIDYTGADIVDEPVHQNQIKYGTQNCRFVRLDLTRDELLRCN